MTATFIHGATVSVGWADSRASLTDLIFGAVRAAVDNSGIDIDRIKSVVLAAHDIVDGRSLSSMVTPPAAGVYLRDEIRLADDGLAALSLGCARIEAGETEYSIVAAWGRPSEGDYAPTSRFAFDAFTTQPFGLDEFSLSSLRLSSWVSVHGEQREARERVRLRRVQSAEHNPRSVKSETRPSIGWPVLRAEAPRFADLAVAAVIGRAEARVRIAGCGHGTDKVSVGERDLVRMEALKQASAQGCAVAGISADVIDLYQLAGSTLGDEALSLEALGLAAPGEGFDVYASSENVNPPGGGESGWCFPAMGLMNVIEAYLQLMGKAGGVQLPGRPRRALASGLSASSGQTAHVAVLEAV